MEKFDIEGVSTEYSVLSFYLGRGQQTRKLRRITVHGRRAALDRIQEQIGELFQP